MPNEVMTEWSDMVFLKWNGSTFSAAAYPKLAKVIPDLVLTDTRGEFIRVLDDGRGVDVSRGLRSAQDHLTVDHHHNMPTTAGSGGDGVMTAVFTDSTNALTYYPGGTTSYNPNPSSGTTLRTYNASNSKSGFGDETRPRNIAFNFLVRAK